MTADHHALDLVRVGFQRLAQITLEAGRVERAAHAEDLILRKSALLQRQIGHRVHRIADHQDDRFRGILQDIAHDRSDDAGIHADQFLARHARLTRHARSHDHDVGIRRSGIIVRHAGQLRIEVHQRSGLENIQHLAFRNAFLDIEENQLVGNLPRRDHIGTGRTHVTCTHYCNFAHDSVCFLSNTLDNR